MIMRAKVNNIIFFGVLAAVVLSLFSCTPKTQLSVTGSTSVTASSSGGDYGKGITVTANFPWSATSSDSWIKVREQGGSTISFTVDANTSYDSREGSIRIVCNELSQTIKVTQNQNNGMLLSKSDYKVSKDGEEITIEVKHNIDYKVTIASGGEWISEVSTKGLETRKHIFAVKSNDTKLQREASILFEGSGLKGEAKIVQPGQKTIFSITHHDRDFDIPTFAGGVISGSIIWGDGVTVNYAEGLSRQYMVESEYTVTFNLDNAESFTMTDLDDVLFIDLRKF